MGKKKGEELKTESLEQEVERLRKSVLGIFELLIPPKEVREEIIRNVYAMELSFLKIIKTLLDYQVEVLEKKTQLKERKKPQKIEIE